MLYRLLLTKFEWPSQPRRSALIRLTLLRNLNRFEDAESRAEAVRRALRLYSHARAIISDCAEPLAVEWKLSEPQIGKVLQAFESVVGGTGSYPPIPPAPVPTSPPRLEENTFAQSIDSFLTAIAQGLPAAGAIEAFGTLGRGSFSHDDKCFYPESAALGPIADRIGLLSTARRLVVSGCEGKGTPPSFCSLERWQPSSSTKRSAQPGRTVLAAGGRA
jgi:hypothetical protein